MSEVKLPIMTQKGPCSVEVEKGQTYYWCTCGLSATQPYCDGSHKGSGMKSQAFVAETTGTVNLCGCKRTGQSPFCDGTHSEL